MIDEIAQLLYHEAHLLDSNRFQEWLDLLAPDLRYRAPARAGVARTDETESEADRLPLFDETKETLAVRIKRLGTGLAWSDIPTTRTRRFISNVVVEQSEPGLFQVRSNFMVFRSRSFADETIFVGCREDLWSRTDTWLLKERKILLDHCRVENINIFL